MNQVRCPRCGYDQRGTVSTWQDTCPLRGICTECGLEFDWSHVLQPEKFEPPWCVEYAPRRVWVKSCVLTYLCSWLPGQFWSRLRMSDRINWKRLTLYLASLAIALVLLQYVVIQTSFAFFVRHGFQTQLDAQIASLSSPPRPTELRSQDALELWPIGYRPASTFEVEQLLANMLAEQQNQWDMDQAWVASNPRISHSVWYCLYEAVILPFRSESQVSVPTSDFQAIPYIAPVELHSVILEHVASRSQRQRSIEVADIWRSVAWQSIVGYAVGVVISLLLPLSFVLLPVSRRRAKVRWRHIGRVTAYGMFIPISAITIIAATFGLMMYAHSPFTAGVVVKTAWWFVPCAAVIWWTFAISRYLKMPHGLAVAILMAVLCAFALLGAAYIIAPGAVVAWLFTW